MYAMLTKICKFVKACYICQRTRVESLKNNPYHQRTPVGYSLMESLSVGIKFIPKGFDVLKYLLVMTCKITNFMLTIQLKEKTAQVLAEVLTHRVICTFGPPKLCTVDKESAFTCEVIQFIHLAMNCQLKIISPFNHGSLRPERQIQTIGKMLTKYFRWKGETWPLYPALAAYAVNTSASLTLLGLSSWTKLFKVQTLQML